MTPGSTSNLPPPGDSAPTGRNHWFMIETAGLHLNSEILALSLILRIHFTFPNFGFLLCKQGVLINALPEGYCEKQNNLRKFKWSTIETEVSTSVSGFLVQLNQWINFKSFFYVSNFVLCILNLLLSHLWVKFQSTRTSSDARHCTIIIEESGKKKRANRPKSKHSS